MEVDVRNVFKANKANLALSDPYANGLKSVITYVTDPWKTTYVHHHPPPPPPAAAKAHYRLFESSSL